MLLWFVVGWGPGRSGEVPVSVQPAEGGVETNEIVKTNSLHIRSLVLSIVLWISFVFFIIAAAMNSAFFSTPTYTPPAGPYSYGHYYGGGSADAQCSDQSSPGMCGISYIFLIVLAIYYIEGFVCVCDSCVKCKLGSSTCRYVANIKSDSSSEQFIAAMKVACPQFRMCVSGVCMATGSYRRE